MVATEAFRVREVRAGAWESGIALRFQGMEIYRIKSNSLITTKD